MQGLQIIPKQTKMEPAHAIRNYLQPTLLSKLASRHLIISGDQAKHVWKKQQSIRSPFQLFPKKIGFHTGRIYTPSYDIKSFTVSIYSRDFRSKSFIPKFCRFFATDSQYSKADTDLSLRNTTANVDPTKPVEPDNCCMSGCVECVWDTYVEEMKAWTIRTKNEASGDARFGKANDIKNYNSSKGPLEKEEIERERNREVDMLPGNSSFNKKIVDHIKTENTSGLTKVHGKAVDENEQDRDTKKQEDDDEMLIAHLPVEIREFMKLEKKLKAKKGKT